MASSAEPGLRAEPQRKPHVRLWFTILGGLATLSLLLLVAQAWLFIRLAWPHQEPLGDPRFGINYSCNQAEYLLLEDPAKGAGGYVRDDRPGRVEWCADTLNTLLSGLGARYVRISVEWSQVEPAEGVYDFSLIDALLAVAKANGAKVLLSIGLKGQRHPEYYLPEWVVSKSAAQNPRGLADGAEISRDPVVREEALAMITATVRHLWGSADVIDAWLADNEPYLASPRAHDWTIGRDFVREEAATISRLDMRDRPVVINHAEHFSFDRRWRWTLEDADIAGTSIYPFRNYEIAGVGFVVPILELGPWAPNYAARAKEAHAAGKQFWITELQAEPWADPDIRLFSPKDPAADLTPETFGKNIAYARRSGADRVYLWGAEWWLYQREHFGDQRWWNLARAVLARSGGR